MEQEMRNIKKQSETNNKKVVVALCLGLIIGMATGIISTVLVYDKESRKNIINNEQQHLIKGTLAEDNVEMKEPVKGTLEEILEQEGFIISTPIVDLYYPEKWKERVRIEQVEGDVHTVQFFAIVEGKEEVHMFDIVFGGEEGYSLGYLERESGTLISINIISYNFEVSEEWTTEEKNALYEMLEDVNYIINMLQNEEEFKLAL